jgi:hypothetical protein
MATLASARLEGALASLTLDAAPGSALPRGGWVAYAGTAANNMYRLTYDAATNKWVAQDMGCRVNGTPIPREARCAAAQHCNVCTAQQASWVLPNQDGQLVMAVAPVQRGRAVAPTQRGDVRSASPARAGLGLLRLRRWATEGLGLLRMVPTGGMERRAGRQQEHATATGWPPAAATSGLPGGRRGAAPGGSAACPACVRHSHCSRLPPLHSGGAAEQHSRRPTRAGAPNPVERP